MVAAIAVEAVSVVGWWGWKRVVRQLADDPDGGAMVLVRSVALRLPSAVARSRRLSARDLGRASQHLVVPALLTLSRDQRAWAPVDPGGWVNRARARLIVGSFDEASGDLDAAIVRDPTSPRLHWLTALAERARGFSSKALEHLATAEGLGAANLRLRVELTPEEASWVRLAGLERRLTLYPRARGRGVIALARELRARGENELGREHLKRETSDPRVELELARWDLEDGLTRNAENRLMALAARRELPAAVLAETWSVTAVLRDRLGDVEAAEAAAATALAYDPKSSSPYRVLAGLAERRGDADGALEFMRRAWGMNPTDVGLLMAVARTAEKAGKFDDARLALERARSVDSADPAPAAALVDFHLRRGELMDATLALSEALHRFPTDPRLLRLADRLRSAVNRR
jgi:tetratricopeptide (TPR) repeat protein